MTEFHKSDGIESASPASWSDVLHRIRQIMNSRAYSPRTQRYYEMWVRRFKQYVSREPLTIVLGDIEAYFKHIQTQASPSVQNQAWNVLLLMSKALGIRADKSRSRPATRKNKAPLLLSRNQVEELFRHLSGQDLLVGMLQYGCGLRLEECLRLRLREVDLEKGLLYIRPEKWPSRMLHMSDTLRRHLSMQIAYVRNLYEKDGDAAVHAFSMDFDDYWLFPARRFTEDAATGKTLRLSRPAYQVLRAIKKAAKASELSDKITCRTLRHCYAAHSLSAGVDAGTIRTCMGHQHPVTTARYLRSIKPSSTPDLLAGLFCSGQKASSEK